MTTTRQIPASTSEKLEAFIAADSDPTAAALKFAVTAGPGTSPQPTGPDWSAGAWVLYTAADGGATALTPLIGSSGATPPAVIVVTTGVWRLWAQVSTGTETPVIDLGLVDVY